MKSGRVIESAIRAAQNLLWQNLPPTHKLPDAAAVARLRQPIRAAPKAPQRKRPCRSRALPTDPSRFVALRSERRARRVDVAKRTASRNMTDDDHNLDDLKDRLSRGFGVQVREDLQVRAEIIIQPEEGRWVFTPNELSDLPEGLNSVLLKSKPEGGWPFRLTLKQYVGLFDH
jgi:hypothetical protein